MHKRKADKAESSPPAPGASKVVLAHVREQAAQTRAQDLPVRLDAQDSVHKMLVATRRLRSALTTFKPQFDAEVVRPLRGELTWPAGELGAALDAELVRDRVNAAVWGRDGGAGPDPGASTADPPARSTTRCSPNWTSVRYHRQGDTDFAQAMDAVQEALGLPHDPGASSPLRR